MSDLKLGALMDEGTQRDAIHIAIAPVTAGEILRPGTHIGLVAGRASAKAEELIGVVDPFLKAPVRTGQRFGMLLYPNTITALRHEWTHPALDKQEAHEFFAALSGSRDWLEAYAHEHDMSYETLINACTKYIETGETTGLGTDISYDKTAALWEHFEIMTGIKTPNNKGIPFEDTPFTCAC